MLSEASAKYAKERTRANYDELLVALMLMISGDREILVPGQITTNEKQELQVQLGMVQASDGRWYYLACSCEEELKKVPGASSVSIKLSDLLRRVKNEQNVGGFCLDPMNGANCFITEEDACVLLDNLANNQNVDLS